MDWISYFSRDVLEIISSLKTIPESLELGNTHKNRNSFQSLWLKSDCVHYKNIIFSYFMSLKVTSKIKIKLHTSYVNILTLQCGGKL